MLASGCYSYASDLLVLVFGGEDAVHLELAAQLSNAGLVIRQFEISVPLTATWCLVRPLACIFHSPGLVPNCLKERLEKWDTSCDGDDAILDAGFFPPSQSDIHDKYCCQLHIVNSTYIVQMARSIFSSVKVSNLLEKVSLGHSHVLSMLANLSRIVILYILTMIELHL